MPTIAFDSTATFSPSTNPSAVVLTGSATNTPNIANIAIFDGTTQVGSVNQFTSTNSWTVTVNLSPGVHGNLTAVSTDMSGTTTTASAPFQLVMGVNNEPYVYQERDLNALGNVVRVKSFDAAGALVGQTSLAGSSGPTPLSVAFDPTATYEGPTGAELTGTTTAYASGATVEIYDGAASTVIDPTTGSIFKNAKDLGAATVNPDGTWSFDAHVNPGQHQFTAVAVGLNGIPTAAESPYQIVAGVVGHPYVYQEVDHGPTGGVAATTSYAKDGTVVSQSNSGGSTVAGGSSSGEVIRSSHNDVMTGDGTGATTFLFRRGFGQDEITNFNYLAATQSPSGVEHDVLSLPQTTFTKMAQVLRHTTAALDGSAVIHLSATDTIKLDGVTKADLVTHPNVIRFHA